MSVKAVLKHKALRGSGGGLVVIKREGRARGHCACRMGEHADTSFNTTGSKWLQPVSEHLSFPLDQVGAPTAGLEGGTHCGGRPGLTPVGAACF